MAAGLRTVDARVYISLAHLMALEPHARGLSFLARQPRRSLLAGNHASRVRGRGLDFDELRRYQPGDDLRHLDWRASLRTGKPVVRTFREERDRPALILVDQRMSMFFGSQRSFKSVLAAELAALAAWTVLRAGDRVGGMVFNDQHIDTLAPLRSRARVQALCAHIAEQNQALDAYRPDVDGSGQLDRVLQRTLAAGGHGQLICLVSDFAGAGAQTLKLLRQLSAHNDVVALHVFDPLAQHLPTQGRLVVTQGQLQLELTVSQQRVHQPLSDFLTGRLHDVVDLLRRSQVPLLPFSSAEPALEQLRLALGRQRP